MNRSIEKRLSALEEEAEPPKRHIATLVDLVRWVSEEPIDHNVTFAHWIEELAAKGGR